MVEFVMVSVRASADLSSVQDTVMVRVVIVPPANQVRLHPPCTVILGQVSEFVAKVSWLPLLAVMAAGFEFRSTDPPKEVRLEATLPVVAVQVRPGPHPRVAPPLTVALLSCEVSSGRAATPTLTPLRAVITLSVCTPKILIPYSSTGEPAARAWSVYFCEPRL